MFEIHTFVNNDALYERMRRSFIATGFSSDAFVPLTDVDDDPYSAISRIGRESTARYPILCHQDVFSDQGAGAAELQAALEQLDVIDPEWVVAGNAGVSRSGRLVRRLVDVHGGSTSDRFPVEVVTLDEDFLVFNARNAPRCSPALAEFHFYGADVCLHALGSGGSAYVVDFPVTHRGDTDTSRGQQNSYWRAYERARQRFIVAWSDHCLFRYVLTPSDTLFLSRSKLLRQLFGSSRALASVAQCRQARLSWPLCPIDRIRSSGHGSGRQ